MIVNNVLITQINITVKGHEQTQAKNMAAKSDRITQYANLTYQPECRIIQHSGHNATYGMYKGLNNCFAIAILNIFFNLNDKIKIQNYLVSETNSNIEQINLYKMFIDLLKVSKNERIPIFTQFRNKLGQLYPIFNNQNQHDAQEFYTAFVQIVDMATAVPIGVDDLYTSIIKDNFTGLFTYIYECTICNRKHEKIEYFSQLILQLEKTIFYALYNWSKGEIDMHCQQCKNVIKHLYNIHINNPPKILTIVFNRFVGHTGCKNNASVDINSNIDIVGFKGNLTGIVRHLGHTGNAGHYNAIVYEQSKWLLCDDHRVSETDFKDFKYSSTCYLLFYVLD